MPTHRWQLRIANTMHLSLFKHHRRFHNGLFDSAATLYHLLLITTTFLTLSIRRLDADRLGG